MSLYPPAPNRANTADHSTIAGLQAQMERLLTEMDQQVNAYAKARQVLEFLTERKKSVLARAFVSIQDKDPEASAAAAEHRARASAGYKTEMQGLMKEQLNAETVIKNFDILQTRLDACRSWCAIERVKLERL